MELPREIPTVMENASNYFMMHGNEIPEFQRKKIVALMGPGNSPVDFIVTLAEALYAVKSDLNDQGKEIIAQAANLASENGWHDMTTRGQQIVNSVRRDMGETVAQTTAQDPKVKDDFVQTTTSTPPTPAMPAAREPLNLSEEDKA